MTPTERAQHIVSSWSPNYMDPSAVETIRGQIEAAIDDAVREENEACAQAINNEEGFGLVTKQWALSLIRGRLKHVMNIGEL